MSVSLGSTPPFLPKITIPLILFETFTEKQLHACDARGDAWTSSILYSAGQITTFGELVLALGKHSKLTWQTHIQHFQGQ